MISVTEVQKAYLAYFGRAADPVGLEYWMNSDTATMRAGFAASAEYATLYSGMTSEQRVEQVYQNLLGRASDPEGKAYWVNEFNAGRETIGSLVVSMQTNALGIDIGTINNRVTYAILFTAQLDTPAEVADYSGTAVADRARTDMSAVTYTDASLATARANITSNSVTVLGEEALPAPTPTPDTTAPTMSSAAVATNGQSIVVTYSEALTGTAEASDYAVTLGSGSTTVTGATIGAGADANKVTLTLSNTIPSGVLVTDLVYDATAGTANSIKDAASNSAATQTLAAVTNNSTATNLSFTLTTANDSFTGGGGDDTFDGTWTDGDAASTLDVGDVLNGGGGTDTLNISSASVGAITLTDANWVLGGVNALIENITVTNDAGAGAIGFATGVNFNTAFSVGGVDLTTSVGAGATVIDMATFTGAADIIATASGAGDITITSGSGPATVNSTTFEGAQTINGAGLTSVTLISSGAGIQTVGSVGTTDDLVTITVTQHGAGNQIITSSSATTVTVNVVNDGTAGNQTINTAGGDDIVNATNIGGTTNVISTGAGDDTITLLATGAATANSITGGTGADNITLVSTGSGFSAPDTIVIATADVGATWLTADAITNFVTAVDKLDLDVAADGTNYTAASEADGSGMADEATVLAAAQVVLDGIVKYYFVYNINNTGNGALYFDADGVDGGEDVIFLAGAVTADFLILGDII